MLTRRHIRVKVMQSLYSISHDGEQSLEKQVFFFKESVKKSYDLYYLLISLFKSVYSHAQRKKILEKKLQYELSNSPTDKILKNPYFKFFAQNKNIHDYLKKSKLNNWETDSEYINQFYLDLINNQFHNDYLIGVSDEIDNKFCLNFYKECIASSDRLYDYLEDNQLTWIDDLPVVNTHILKQIKSVKIENIKSLDLPSFNIDSEETKFGIELLANIISKTDSLETEIIGKTPNWESDRIADIDFILLKMAISELLFFNEIPVRVTINEYIEIAKDYSTPKSNIFINGVLDNISKDFKVKGRLNKEGRGLL